MDGAKGSVFTKTTKCGCDKFKQTGNCVWYQCIGFPGSQVVVSVDWANKILRLVLVSTHTSVLLLFDVRVLAADY